jgi:hypothetical protein
MKHLIAVAAAMTSLILHATSDAGDVAASDRTTSDDHTFIFTRVYVNREGRWRTVALQTTPIQR